ncbi:MAG: hypothetical protein OEV87_12045 [Phycisphaerae bacterium]|nr:hypothetical protein [Phycisphaerae bacterium]
MSNDEKKFEHYVNSLRFDDAPSKEHQDKLEQQLLEAYDQRQPAGDAVEPVSLYMRKLSIAAGFLIACGVLFWGIDKAFITRPHPDFIANHPERDTLEQIIENEQAAGAERKNLIAEMSDIWKMIRNEDADALVSVLGSDSIARSVRLWAAGHLGQFGNQQALDMLDSAILNLGVTDPNDPLKVAASEIRKRLNLPEMQAPAKSETPSLESLDE